MRKLNIWPFNRRKKPENSTVPPELQHYYESEHRERVGLAWLIAFLSLVLTISVVLGLFFGGRWTYRKIANKDNTNQPTQIAVPSQPPKPQPEPSKNQTSTNSPIKTAKPANSNKSKKTISRTPSANTKKTVVSKPKSKTVALSAPASRKLINTGPGNTLAIFLGVSVLGTVLHELYNRGKIKSQSS